MLEEDVDYVLEAEKGLGINLTADEPPLSLTGFSIRANRESLSTLDTLR
jgi:hypothetical protein